MNDAGLLAQSRTDTFRASGPGGQKRNKTDSAVRLHHDPSGQTVIAVESRSQHENRAKALRRLRKAIALGVRSPIDLESYQPGAEVADCLTGDSRLHVGMKDHRYNHVLAEILDLLEACEYRIAAAAKHLGVTTGNLSGFLTRDDKLKARVNQMRSKMGSKPLR